MDVISLGKAVKAKKKMQDLNNRLGEGVQASYEHVKERLEAIEEKGPAVTAHHRISEISGHTAINLNKINLHIATLIHRKRYRHKDMIVDDFQDDSGIDYNKSQNITWDENKKSVTLKNSGSGFLITSSESIAYTPTFFALSATSNLNNIITISMSWDKENSSHIIVSENNELILEKKDESSYYHAGTWESQVIDLGEGSSFYKMQGSEGLFTEDQIQIQVRWSKDGVSFSSYQSLNVDGTLPESKNMRFIQCKISLSASIESMPQSFAESSYEYDKIKKTGDAYALSDGIKYLRLRKFNITEFHHGHINERGAFSLNGMYLLI